MSDKKGWKIEGVFARDLDESETASLLEMMQHRGWQILTELKTLDRAVSLDVVMNPAASDRDVAHHRIVYNCLTADIEMESRLRQIIAQQSI